MAQALCSGLCSALSKQNVLLYSRPVAASRGPALAGAAPPLAAAVPPAGRRSGAVAARAARGGNLLDSDTSTSLGKSPESLRRKPPIYKVMLHNDSFNRREYVVKVLLKVVSEINVDDALNVMQEAHEQGVALVVACAQDRAEGYVEDLRLNGLTSTMEPGH